MLTDAIKLAKKNEKMDQPERLSWGIIEFQVTDLDRTIAFWTQALGLRVRTQDHQSVAIGTEKKTLFVFHGGASVAAKSRYLGMYHVAIGVPDQAEFSRLIARLLSMHVLISVVDHLMSKAIYFADPDGLEIEIALETPERFGEFGDMSNGIILYDADGQPHNGRATLNVGEELQHAKGENPDAPLSNEATIAHVHFKVADLDSASTWFEGVGFAKNLMLPDFGLADMGAGASYTHRIAMNTWSGPNLYPAPIDMARLTHYTLHVHESAVMANAHGLELTGTGLTGRDPSGTEMSLIPVY